MRRLMYLSLLFLVACTKEGVDRVIEDVVEGAQTGLNLFGPEGGLAATAIGLIFTTYKWICRKGDMEEIVTAIQKTKKDMSPEQKKLLSDGLEKALPSKVKKVISKVKRKL